MQAEAETILKMSETLEGANFTSDQSKAFIESVALSMKTFAVTPELLDGRLDKHKKHTDGQFDEQRKHYDRRFDEQKEHYDRRFDDLDRRFDEHKQHTDRRFDEQQKHNDQRFDDIQEMQRSLLRHVQGLTLVMIAGLMAALVAFLTS